jgi:hypothetical protein
MFNGGGVNGGEVTLRATNSQAELDGISQNSWIMLAGNTSSGAPDFKWYRVLAADEILGSGPWTRNLTLAGADWQRPEWGAGTVTQATIMPHVVGVFEKTIRLETTGLWTQRNL